MPRPIVIGLVLLALASALLIVLVPRWQVVPGSVLADPGFATLGDAGRGAVWQRVGDGRIDVLGDGVRLANDDPAGVVGLDQVFHIPAGTQAFRVTATVELRDVVAGPERWQQPRILVHGVDPRRQAALDGRFQLIDRAGSFGPERLSVLFPVGSPIDEARLMLRLVEATGVMEVRDLVVEAAIKPAARHWLRRALIAVWLGVAAGIGLALWWRSEDRLAASLVLGGLGSLALMVVLPQAIRQPLHDLLGGGPGNPRLELLKPLLHLVGFVVLATASRLAQPARPLGFFVVAWLAAAVLLEASEIYFSIFDRSDLVDMTLNAMAAMLGLLLAGRFLRWRRGRARSPDPGWLGRAMRRP
jgi:hypothetical protein